MTIYDFDTQLLKGKQAENILDAYWKKRGIKIETVSMNFERLGIDRIFEYKNIRYTIEYKTDFLASKTGNAFIETVSVAGARLGWAYTSLAQGLVYFLPDTHIVYYVNMIEIKRNLMKWESEFPTREVKNKTYTGNGILLPLKKFEEIGIKTIIDA